MGVGGCRLNPKEAEQETLLTRVGFRLQIRLHLLDGKSLENLNLKP